MIIQVIDGYTGHKVGCFHAPICFDGDVVKLRVAGSHPHMIRWIRTSEWSALVHKEAIFQYKLLCKEVHMARKSHEDQSARLNILLHAAADMINEVQTTGNPGLSIMFSFLMDSIQKGTEIMSPCCNEPIFPSFYEDGSRTCSHCASPVP